MGADECQSSQKLEKGNAAKARSFLQSNTYEQVNAKGIQRSFVCKWCKKMNTVGICSEVILQFVARLPVCSVEE